MIEDRAAKVDELEDLARQLGHKVDQHDAATPEPWRMEVLAQGERTWATNAARYRTREAALAAGEDLAGRWSLVRYWRAVDESSPLREAYVQGSEDGPPGLVCGCSVDMHGWRTRAMACSRHGSDGWVAR